MSRVLLMAVPPPPAVVLCLDPLCPFKAGAQTPERAYEKLQAHVQAWHPEMGTPKEAA